MLDSNNMFEEAYTRLEILSGDRDYIINDLLVNVIGSKNPDGMGTIMSFKLENHCLNNFRCILNIYIGKKIFKHLIDEKIDYVNLSIKCREMNKRIK